MKKFLSMVLALVMAMSLVTISAGAADFTDADSIDYLEAVEVMTAVGVVDGYTDGSFGPDAYLTRGAAAKIICNLILGPTTAGALVADAAPYSDVPTDNVFAGYIAYCQKEGIISGYADGTFKPGNSLTGYAFMKMLLGALGYKAEVEGYTGNNWSINVAKQALAIGLDDGLEDEFNGVKTVTRQEALLYAFNTMKATMVGYANDSTITVGDIVVSTKSDAAEKGNDISEYRADYVGPDSETVDGKMQFCEQYFGKLKAYEDEDVYGRPATRWEWKDDEIGTYNVKADLTYVDSTPSLYQLRKALNLKTSETPTFYVTWDLHMDAWSSSKWNSVDEYEVDLASAVSSDATTLGQAVYGNEKYDEWASDWADTYYNNSYFQGNWDAAYDYWFETYYADYSYLDYYPIYGKGQVVEVYYDKTGATANEIIVIDETFGKINAVKKDDNGRYVTVEGAPSGARFYTEDFAKGDYVVYTTGVKAEYGIVTMAAAEMISGTITFFNGSTYVVIDGVGYYCHAADWATSMGAGVGDEVNVWLDSYGYIVDMVVTESSSDPSKLALVVKIGTEDDWGNTDARIVYGDGVEEIVTLYNDPTYIADVTTNADQAIIYSHTTTSGKLKLSVPTGYRTIFGGEDFSYTKGQTMFGEIPVDASTNFVYIDDVGPVKGIKTYVGHKNAPSIEEDAATAAYGLFSTNAGTTAATLVYVFADSEKTTSTSADYTIVIPDTYYLWQTTDADGAKQMYYALRTLDNTYLYVDAQYGSVYADDIAVDKYAAAVVYDSITYNTDNGYVADAFNSEDDRVVASSEAGTYTVKYKNGVLYIEGEDSVALAENAECYIVAYNGDSFVVEDATSLDGEYLAYTVVLDDEPDDGGEAMTIVLRELKG